MWYQSCNIILDTSIRNYENGVWIQKRIIKDFVESANVSILNFCIFTVHCIKREMQNCLLIESQIRVLYEAY